jgi:hypothetical protein
MALTILDSFRFFIFTSGRIPKVKKGCHTDVPNPNKAREKQVASCKPCYFPAYSAGLKSKITDTTGRPTISTPFTAAEILECIHKLGYTSRLRSEEIGEFGECVSITITTEEELDWYLYLGFSGPYFEEFEISTYVYTKENPYLEANRWHANDHLSVVTVDCNTETGNPEYENGMFTLHQRMMWHMEGLKLAEGVKTALAIWDEEYVELLEQIHPDIEAEND